MAIWLTELGQSPNLVAFIYYHEGINRVRNAFYLGMGLPVAAVKNRETRSCCEPYATFPILRNIEDNGAGQAIMLVVCRRLERLGHKL